MRWPHALVCSLLVLVGCSDGSDASSSPTTTSSPTDDTSATSPPPLDPERIEGGAQAYVDALASTYVDPGGAQTLPDDQIECLSSAWVDVIGVEAFAAAGISPEALASEGLGLGALDIDEDLADELIDAVGECNIDLRRAVLESLDPADDLPADVRTCLDAAVTIEVAQEAFRQRLLGIQEPSEAFDRADACLEGYDPSAGGG